MSSVKFNEDYNLEKPILILKNVELEAPGLIEDFLKNNKIKFKILEYYLTDISIDTDLYSAAIILGGPMSANDKLLFIGKEIKLIQELIHKNIPLLGICLGSQLISKSGGGFVEKNHLKEIGVYNVFLTSIGMKCPLFKNLSNPFKVFQWHSETFTIPPLGEWLATSETCLNQAVQLGTAYGIQFHFEFTPIMVKKMVENYPNDIIEGDFDIMKILDKFNHFYPQIKENGYKIMQNFLNLIIEMEKYRNSIITPI